MLWGVFDNNKKKKKRETAHFVVRRSFCYVDFKLIYYLFENVINISLQDNPNTL